MDTQEPRATLYDSKKEGWALLDSVTYPEIALAIANHDRQRDLRVIGEYFPDGISAEDFLSRWRDNQ